MMCALSSADGAWIISACVPWPPPRQLRAGKMLTSSPMQVPVQPSLPGRQPLAGAVRRPDDGLDRPPLPLLPPPAEPPRAAVHGDDDHGRADPWRRAAPPGLQCRGASGGAAAGRQRAGRAGALRPPGRAVGLRRDQPQLRLPQRARAARLLRRLPDGRAAAGGRLRQGDGRCRRGSGHGEAPHRHRQGARATTSCATSSAR